MFPRQKDVPLEFPLTSTGTISHFLFLNFPSAHCQLCYVGTGKPQMRSGGVQGSAVMPFSGRLVFQSSQCGEEGRNKGMDGRPQQRWWSVHGDLLCCTSYNFSYSLKRKELPLSLSWGRRDVTHIMVSVLLHHFPCICSWFPSGAGWNGLHGPDVVGNNCIVNSSLKAWLGLWGLCRMAGGIPLKVSQNLGRNCLFVSVHPQLSFWDNNSLGKQRNIMKVAVKFEN